MEETVPEPMTPRDGIEAEIREEMEEALRGVIDPGTGLDAVRMGLVKETRLEKTEAGYRAVLTFRPSSPVCPMAFKLAWEIKQSAQSVKGIDRAEVKVEGYDRAAELEAILETEEKS